MSEFDELSTEELEKALASAALDQMTGVPEQEPETEEQPAEEAKPEPAPADEPTQGTLETTEEPKEEAVETPAAPPESEPDLDDEELKTNLAEMQARAKHWEQVAGRHAGKMDFLEKKLSALEQRPSERRVESDDISETEDTPTPTRPAIPPTSSDSVKTWAISQAINAGVSEFAQAHSDFSEYNEAMGKYMKDIGYDASKMLTSDDPISAQRESRRVLEEAYWHARAERESARRVELQQKRAEQTAKLAEAKRKAAPSAPAAVPPAKPKEKAPDEMSDDELSEAMRKATEGQLW